MNVEFSDAKKFADIMSALSNFFDEMAIVFDEDGMKFKGLDVSKVLFVEFNVSASSFDKFEVDGKEVIGVSMPTLVKVLKRVKKSDAVRIQTDGSFLAVSLIGKSRRTFRIAQIDVEEAELEFPELPYTAKVVLDSKAFADIVSDAKLLSDALKMKITEDGRFVAQADSESSDYNVEISPFEDALIDFSVEKEGFGAYGLGYLDDLAKLAKSVPKVELELGEELPLHVKIADSSLCVNILLAPRVED